MSEYVIGQRWISASEPELGLGMVSAVAVNRVTIVYLASDECRVYAQDNAPLTRVRFFAEDVVETVAGLQGVVKSITELEGIISYRLLSKQGEIEWIDEQALSHHLQFNKPQDKLFIGQAEEGRWFALRYQSWQHLQRLQKSPVKGLLGARVALIPHQLYIAHEVTQRDKVRVMLADEVGLGKTIEAGLIMHYSLHTGLSERILVIVPESLQHQWLVEMLRRFNLKFSLFDESRCEAIEEENPFLSEQLVLCSLEFFEQHADRKAQAVSALWDIVVVDEAHHLQWSEQAPGEAYEFVEQLAESTDGLILLSATPEQLGKETYFAQLKLLDADRFYSLEQFNKEQQEFEPIARLAEKIVHRSVLNDADKKQLKMLIEQDLGADFLNNIEDEVLRQEVIDQLIDRHGTGRILFRNSRHVIKGFPQRKFYAYPLEQDNKDETVCLQWLVTYLKSLGQEQVLLICQHADTVLRLHKQLRDKYALNVAAFHEGMSIIERDRAAAYFADQEAQTS
ncbi:RNA polymerase-associated protein RapA [Methyloprofundus sp.]|uniref:RNA polymerase-associated protein RapA n=1 Tax=Methyloprofundus sp. TaxID=2020875 RepID=UPI003D0FE5C7